MMQRTHTLSLLFEPRVAWDRALASFPSRVPLCSYLVDAALHDISTFRRRWERQGGGSVKFSRINVSDDAAEGASRVVYHRRHAGDAKTVNLRGRE